MGKMIPSRIGPIIETEDGYLAFYRMERCELYASKDFFQKPIAQYDVDLQSKIKEFSGEKFENKVALIKYIISQVTHAPIDENIINYLTEMFFDEECYVENDAYDGPKIHLHEFEISVNVNGHLQLKDGNDIIAESISPIYEKMGNSAYPRVACFNTIADMILSTEKDELAYCLIRTDLIDQLADYLKKVTEDAGNNAIYENKFNAIIDEKKETNISYEKNEIRINQGGKIIVIEGGDGVALEIHGETITVSRKGMRREIALSKSIEEAASKITSRVSEVMKPCGEKAKVIYVEKIKPGIKDFSKKTAKSIKDSCNEFKESESREDDDIKVVKPKRKKPKVEENNSSDSTKYTVLLSAVMTLIVILLLFIGGC